jgi:hypothetical protein
MTRAAKGRRAPQIRNPVIPAQAGIYDEPQHAGCFALPWVPTFVGMTVKIC